MKLEDNNGPLQKATEIQTVQWSIQNIKECGGIENAAPEPPSIAKEHWKNVKSRKLGQRMVHIDYMLCGLSTTIKKASDPFNGTNRPSQCRQLINLQICLMLLALSMS